MSEKTLYNLVEHCLRWYQLLFQIFEKELEQLRDQARVVTESMIIASQLPKKRIKIREGYYEEATDCLEGLNLTRASTVAVETETEFSY